jgi:hypothetical protein
MSTALAGPCLYQSVPRGESGIAISGAIQCRM